MASKYQVLTQIEHVFARPGMYIGSMVTQPFEQFIPMPDGTFQKKNLMINPGLYKLFDEALVNAYDQSILDPTLKHIKVYVDKTSMSFMNDGKGIPIELFDETTYIPEVIFGRLLSGSNFDDTAQRFTGGQNGLGIKLCNLFSTEFSVELCDSVHGYRQTFSQNMSVVGKPKITKKTSKPYVKISLTPDLARFGLEEIDTQHLELFQRRVYDLAALTHAGVAVQFNDNKIKIKDFGKYTQSFQKDPIVSVKDTHWEFSLCTSDQGFAHMSFVNGIHTVHGGTHVDYLVYHAASRVIELFDQKQKKFAGSLKPHMIRDKLFVLLKCQVSCPTFNSQTKEQLTTPTKSMIGVPRLSDKDVQKLYKAFAEQFMEDLEAKEQKKLAKTDGKKTNKVVVPKLDDARFAGTAKSERCTLIITEGDSARTFAISGLSTEDRAWFGVFPLRGKLLNVRDASVSQVNNNAEITALKQILGLKHGKKYEKLSDLRYGKLMILTDQDLDGHHIKGLVLNFIDHFWPELFGLGFTCSMFTPVVKASKGPQVKSYYSTVSFEADQKAGILDGYKIKYYKGLGTSSAKEAKEYFSNLTKNKIQFVPDQNTPEALSKAFKKDRADDRKEWILQNTGREDFTVNNANITKFLDEELVQFSIYDNQRSIPSAMDGLKPSQRKILYTVLEKCGNDEIKVAQLAPKVAEFTHYHHGEQSLVGAIVNMAQDFVGSNQVNLLLPNGQFGSRIQMGKDAASARYIFTQVSPMTKKLFPKEDTGLLKFEMSDGHVVEPTYFCPVVPMVLINGANGIGTGFSTFVPTYKMSDVTTNLKRYLHNQPLEPMDPYYEGFKGRIVHDGKGKYEVYGAWTLDKQQLCIHELPLGVATDQLKESLDELGWDYINQSTENKVDFVVQVPAEADLCKSLPLRKTMNIHNMYLFDAQGKIKKYESPLEILRDFAEVRKKLYETRRLAQLEATKEARSRLENKIRFMELVMNDQIKVFRVARKDIIHQLEAAGLVPYDNWNMYLTIHVDEFTREKIESLQASIASEVKKQHVLETTHATEMWLQELN